MVLPVMMTKRTISACKATRDCASLQAVAWGSDGFGGTPFNALANPSPSLEIDLVRRSLGQRTLSMAKHYSAEANTAGVDQN